LYFISLWLFLLIYPFLNGYYFLIILEMFNFLIDGYDSFVIFIYFIYIKFIFRNKKYLFRTIFLIYAALFLLISYNIYIFYKMFFFFILFNKSYVGVYFYFKLILINKIIKHKQVNDPYYDIKYLDLYLSLNFFNFIFV
jgi:hypothetical protein